MCYANSNMKLVKRNQKLHNPYSPLLIGEVKESDVVKEVNSQAILILKLGCSKVFFFMENCRISYIFQMFVSFKKSIIFMWCIPFFE